MKLSKAISRAFRKNNTALLFVVGVGLWSDLALGELKLYRNESVREPLSHLIAHSDKFLDIQLLTLDCDTSTEPFVAGIVKKSQAGTHVRMIVNSTYSYMASSCLDRLKKGGVEVKTAKTHSSYWVNDRNELLFGSENLVRMNLVEGDKAVRDEDLMLYSTGGLSQDAEKDFQRVWSGTKNQSALRWTEQNCQFLTESAVTGQSEISDFILQRVSQAKDNVFLSSVRGETTKQNSLAGQIIAKLQGSPASVDFLGNSAASGDGELTMIAEEWKTALVAKGMEWLASVVDFLSSWDRERVWSKNKDFYQSLKSSKIAIHQFPTFLHFKVWDFDSSGFLVTSANLTDDSFGPFHETAIFCRVEELEQQWQEIKTSDLSRSTIF